MMAAIGLKDDKDLREHYVQTALTQSLLETIQPHAPTSRLQKYRLTDQGRAVLGAARKRESSS
jgi:hypothetical protein